MGIYLVRAAGERGKRMEFSLFSELAELPVVTWITLAAAAAMIATLVAAIVRARKSPVQMPQKDATRALVYGALCVALSFLLSYIRLFRMPQGGSITLASMLPVALYANRFGTGKGLLAGLALGVLQFVQDPVAVHWAQPGLDYLLAFACIGLAGLFPQSLPIGLLVGGIGRIICSTVSGAIFFAQYAPAGMNPWIYSTIYNTISLGPDAIICIVIALLPMVKRAFERIMPAQKTA